MRARSARAVVGAALAVCAFTPLASPAAPKPVVGAPDPLALDIFTELIEINSTDTPPGNVTPAAEAMRKRLLDAGFPPSDLVLDGPNERKKNLVVRLHGTGKHKPILLNGHLDVVAARREDWTTDPFKFVTQGGYFYGRGTQDMKSADAIMVTTLIRLRKEHFQPSRDIILALTADEEGGSFNGVAWLMHNHRELVDAEYMIDEDTNSVVAEHGVPQFFEMDGTEKIYADYQLTVTNAGGHSSEPVPDNAIYILAEGLRRLGRFQFPFELNNVTRSYYERMAGIESGQRAADMKAIVQSPPDQQAIERLARDPIDNAMQRTTCVATRLEGGHANNALPQKAQAVVNCRILPGHTAEEIRQDLIAVLGNPSIVVRYITAEGQIADQAPADRGFAPATPNAELLQPLEKLVGTMWPGLVVVPTMAVGASDAVYSTAAGIPTFGLGGIAIDRDDQRMHGRDERVGSQSFYTANEFTYRLVKALTTH